MESLPRFAYTHVGLDVHRDSISVAVLPPDRESPEVEMIAPDDASVRRLFRRLGDPGRLRACYEAGPTGYGLCRFLATMGVRCDVVAPSLIPRAPGDKVKTDKRDCKRLARLHRVGELVAVSVPTPAEEGVRDLCRARTALVADRRRARQRISALLLRHGVVYRDGKSWTLKHLEWLGSRHFDEPGVDMAFRRYLSVLSMREADVAAVEGELMVWFGAPLFAERTRRLVAYRGIDRLAALVFTTEVCDWRRFGSPRQFMAYCGLVPSESSSGPSINRGGLTKAGNPHVRRQLIESAWAYQHPAKLTKTIAERQVGANPDTVARAWKAQLRLARRFRQLTARKDSRNVVVSAVARELAGFIWAEMTAPASPPPVTAG